MTTCHLLSYNLDRFLKAMLTDFKTSTLTLDDDSFNYEWKLGTFNMKSLSKGGFGLVFDVTCRNGKIQTRSGRDVVAKCNKNRLHLDLMLIEDIFAVDYDVSEIYFAALLSYINRLKICPFICKYLSVNLVDEEYILFIQKYEVELLTFQQLSPDHLVNFLFQLTYTVYILKMYLGLVHFDVHLRNVMVTKSNRSFLIADHKQGIYLPEMDFEIRLIDFGFCLADLSNSVDPFLKNPLKIAPINFKKQHRAFPELFYSTRNSVSKLMTIELQYFMLHIYQLTKRNHSENHPICVVVKNFAEALYEKDVDLNTPSMGDKNVILSNHDVGVECNITHPTLLMKGLLRYCQRHGGVFQEDGYVRYCPFPVHTFRTENMQILRAQAEPSVSLKYNTFIKQNIPLVAWFEESHYALGTTFGKRVMFPIDQPFSINQMKQETCLHVLLKNVPFSSANAYMSFDKKITFRKKTSFDTNRQLYYCGNFLWMVNKAFKFNEQPKLLLGLNKTTFFIFYFQYYISQHNTLKLIKENNLDVLINATSSLGFSFKGDDISASKSALFYITF